MRRAICSDRSRDEVIPVNVDRILRQLVDRTPDVPVVDAGLAVELHEVDERQEVASLLVGEVLPHQLEVHDLGPELTRETPRDEVWLLPGTEGRTGGMPLPRIGRVIVGTLPEEDLGLLGLRIQPESNALEGDAPSEPGETVKQHRAVGLRGIHQSEQLSQSILHSFLAVWIALEKGGESGHGDPHLLVQRFGIHGFSPGLLSAESGQKTNNNTLK